MKMDDYLLPELLEQVGLVAESQGKSVVDILVEKGVITPKQVAKAKAEQFGAELVEDHELDRLDLVIARLPASLPFSFLKKHRMVPLVVNAEEVIFAVDDPSNLNAIDEAVYLVGKRQVGIQVASEQAIKTALGRYFLMTEEEYTASFKAEEEMMCPR